MGLFKIPKRTEADIQTILAKSREEYKPKVVIKGGGETLLSKLNAIKKDVEIHLGKDKDKYLCITSDEEFLNYCQQAVQDGVVAIDTETDSLDSIKAHLVGVCLYSRSQKPAYVPVGHISVITEQKVQPQVSIEAITEGMKILKRAKCVFHNAYYDRVVIYQNTCILLDVYDDTLIMAWYLNENEPHGLKYLYNKYIAEGKNGVHTFSELFDGIPFCYIPYDVGYIYGAFDSLMTYELYMFFKPFLTIGSVECEECNLKRVAKVYDEVEKPLMDVLVKMKIQGVRFDFSRAKELKKKYLKLKDDAIEDFNKAVAVYESEIHNRVVTKQDIEYPVNYNSPQQISVLFYDIIKTGIIFKKEPRGTGKHVLEEIVNNKKYKDTPLFNIAQTLQEVKKYDKLIGGFIDKLSENAREHNGRIFCDFNQVGANTLRLSSSSPNLQQVPSRNSDIRNMFVPEKDCVFVNLDFSQQEMMAVASLADDDKMLESFHLGRDIYSHVASIAFNVPYEDCLEFYTDGTVNKEGKIRRKKSKAICLGICYGKGVPAIAEDLHISIELAQQIKDSILKAFPKLAQYLENVVEFGKEHGYVENYFGAKRRLPELQLDDYDYNFGNDVAENTKKYYKSLYSSKLKKAKYRTDITNIIANAKSKGIDIQSNQSLIAQATRNAYNCVDKETEILTTGGWKKYNEVHIGDSILSYNMSTNSVEFDTIKSINVYDNIDEDVTEFVHPSFSAVSTHNHRWVVYDAHSNSIKFKTTEKLSHYGMDRILRCANNNFEEADYSDDFLRLCGWVLTDCHYRKNKQHNISSAVISQSKPNTVKRIQKLLNNLGIDAHEGITDIGGNYLLYTWDLHKKNSLVFFKLFPERKLTYDFIFSLSQRQANILLNELILGDGSGGRRLTASSKDVANLYQCLAFVAGKAASISEKNSIGRKAFSDKISNSFGYIETKNIYYSINILKRDKIQIYNKHCVESKANLVWCPTTGNNTWVARRNGKVFITGNSPVQSTAAILTKMAMNNIDKNKDLQKMGVKLVLTIHDEVALNVPKNCLKEAIKIAKKEFLDAGKDLKADLRCDIEVAECWAGESIVY